MTGTAGSNRFPTTIFKSGHSQAVRVPAALRIDSASATIEEIPEGLLIRPLGEDFGLIVARLREFQKAHEGELDGDLVEELEDLQVDSIPSIDDVCSSN